MIQFGNILVRDILIERGLYDGFPNKRDFYVVITIEDEIMKFVYDDQRQRICKLQT